MPGYIKVGGFCAPIPKLVSETELSHITREYLGAKIEDVVGVVLDLLKKRHCW